MREIKFRAWDTNGSMGMCADFMDFNREMLAQNLGDPWNDERFIRMQYTGLKDKNGREIYEGDVVVKPYVDPLGGLHTDTEDGRFRVGFEHGQFVLYRREPQALVDWCEKEQGEYVSNYGNLTVVKDKTVLEVIGNIYENPELCATKS
jgi:uncharacterized phage protein (TIGR01671 family)